jgi:hypothetical protein
MKETTLLWSIALTGIFLLLLTLLVQVNECMQFAVARPFLATKEPFQNSKPEKEKVDGVQDTLGAADADLNEFSKPYHLLEANSRRETTLKKVGSESCYENDFQKEIQKTGSYNQLTNNYRRAGPDSCNTYMQEFVTSFYNAADAS